MNLATTTKPEKAVKSFVRIEGGSGVIVDLRKGEK